MMKRRNFLKLCLAGCLTRFSLPFVNKNDKINEVFTDLSIIHLKGGNDAFNTVVPLNCPEYFAKRPGLALDKNSLLPLSASYGLNPALSQLHTHFKQGNLAVLLGIGYPNPSFSHVRANQIWRSANCKQLSDDFWLSVNTNLKTQPITIEGFDTHENQAEKHACLLGELDSKIAQTNQCESGRGLCFIYSEMGRSLNENPEGGTDHGHSNLAFLIGQNVRGGVYGAYSNEDNEENAYAIDFRKVYACIEQGNLDNLRDLRDLRIRGTI